MNIKSITRYLSYFCIYKLNKVLFVKILCLNVFFLNKERRKYKQTRVVNKSDQVMKQKVFQKKKKRQDLNNIRNGSKIRHMLFQKNSMA